MLEGLENDYSNSRKFFKKFKVIRKDHKLQTSIIKNDNDGTNKNSRTIPETLRRVTK